MSDRVRCRGVSGSPGRTAAPGRDIRAPACGVCCASGLGVYGAVWWRFDCPLVRLILLCYREAFTPPVGCSVTWRVGLVEGC